MSLRTASKLLAFKSTAKSRTSALSSLTARRIERDPAAEEADAGESAEVNEKRLRIRRRSAGDMKLDQIVCGGKRSNRNRTVAKESWVLLGRAEEICEREWKFAEEEEGVVGSGKWKLENECVLRISFCNAADLSERTPRRGHEGFTQFLSFWTMLFIKLFFFLSFI